MIAITSKLLKNYNGMTLWPFLLIKHKSHLSNRRFMNHESIHAAQQKELFIILFYLWYGMDYSYRFLKYRNHNKAYRNIIFEREAYTMEEDMNYLKQRKYLGFLKYYSKKHTA